jgi:hypothetical protein
MTFLSTFSKQAPVFLVCLRLFLRDNKKNILAFPFIEFHVPSKERGGEGEVGNVANGCAR